MVKNNRTMKTYKTIFYYSVITGNRGDMAIRKSIVDAIESNLKVPFAFFNAKYEELTEKRIVNQLNTDGVCLIIAGSGLYTNYSTSSGWYFPCATELFTKIKIPIMLLGLGCNNNLGQDIFNGELTLKTKESIKLINELAVISTVRDQRTYKLLSGLGISKHKLMLDPANFLTVPKIPKEKRVAINLAQHSPALGRFDGNNDIRNKNIKSFVTIGKYLQKKGYQLVFIAHDALEHSLILDLQKYLPTLEFVNTDNINMMLQEYARCEFAIGVKMHANILSFAAGTPFISLYYDVKSIEYLKLIHWSNFGHSVFEPYNSWVKEKIDDLCENARYYTNQFRKIKQLEQIEFNKLIEDICNIIETSI
jgi:polysaccharide pyruvyl transferase WcaK-like protein